MLQANAPPGQLAVELEEGADFQYVVHQASGMVAAQLDISVGEALMRLRAYAFGNDRRLTDVAEDVVARRCVSMRRRTKTVAGCGGGNVPRW